jgi:hypothetical protein
VVRFTRLLVALLLITLARRASGFDISYWVWQRSEPLSPDEIALLETTGVHQIYWHVGELGNSGITWQWKSRFQFPSSSAALRVIPVVRLVSKEASPFNERSFESLRNNLMPIVQLNGALQIDYDSPDRLLGEYAGALRQIHGFTRELTITALPHWSRKNSWKVFQGAVDALFPMFYDFEPEPILANDRPNALIDSEKMAQMTEEWSHSPLPWHAGLPAFARLTVYDSTGRSRGQIRNWNWDEITFNPRLVELSRMNSATFALRATGVTRISNVSLASHDRLVARWTELRLLDEASERARKAGAAGCAIFRFPNSATASSGFSPRQLTHPRATPALHVQLSGDALRLENAGEGDLFPQLASQGNQPRGYRLEIFGDTPLLREAEPGDFSRISGFAGEDPGASVAIPFARRVSFGFSELRAGQSLQTGLIQLAPGVSFGQIRYRIQPIEDKWKPIEPN